MSVESSPSILRFAAYYLYRYIYIGDINDLRGRRERKARSEQQAAKGAARQAAEEKRRELKLFSERALKVKKMRDARAFSELLRLASVSEDSVEWRKFWEWFYS